MDVLKDGILIVLMLGVFAFGYFLMTRLDKFLGENRKAIEKADEKKEPSCVMLTEELSEEEIVEEVRRFRQKHESVRVVLYDSTAAEWPESVKAPTEQKR